MEINRFYDKLRQCQNSGNPVFTDFMDYGELLAVRSGLAVSKDVMTIEYQGFFDDERRMIGFIPTDYKDYMSDDDIESMFPVAVLKLTPVFEGFIEHRAMMGSVLGLGLDRRLFGDMLIIDGTGYILCHERAAKIISDELISVGKIQVSVEAIDPRETKELKPATKLIKTTVASLRLDGVIKTLGGFSRTSASTMIQKGYVKVNQVETFKNHKMLDEGDIISIKGKGKFRLEHIGQKTKKDRIILHIAQYI